MSENKKQEIEHPKDTCAVRLGRRGGKAGTGKAKARTSEQARKAAMVRWNKPK